MTRREAKFDCVRRFAENMKGLSPCSRIAVACVIFREDYSAIVGIGYNGPPRGISNDACTGIAGRCGCVHAEANALIKAGDLARGSLLLTTLSPCLHCSGLIINAGVRAVIWSSQYREDGGVRLLERAKVPQYTVGEWASLERQDA